MQSIHPPQEGTMKELPPEALEHIALYFQALAEPMRLQLINLLRSGEHNVGELAPMSPNTWPCWPTRG
jgi:hypothetical protein